MTARSGTERRGTTRQQLLVPALVLLTTITALVSSLGAPLVPALARHHEVPLATAQWSLTIAVLVGAVATPLLGRLGGFRRRREVLVGGLATVAVGLLVAALPLGFGWLVVGRGLQGVGLGLAPLAIATARDAVPPDRRGGAIAVLSVSVVAGAGLGYPVTGLVADRLGLAASFWLGLAVTMAALVLVVAVVPRSTVADDAPVDWLGAALLAGGSGGLLLALSQGGAWGWGSTRTLGVAAAASLLAAAWVRRSFRTPHPLVDLRLAGRRGVVGANVTALLAGAGAYLMITLMIVLAQAPRSSGYGLGMSVLASGFLLVPYSLASVLGNRLTRSLGRWVGPDTLLPVGCSIYLLASLVMARWHDEPWQLFLVMGVAGVGSGCTFAAMPGLVVRFVPLEETGSAMAFNMVLRYLGFSLGSAVGPVLLDVFSDGPVTGQAFTAALMCGAVLWVVTVLGNLALARQART